MATSLRWYRKLQGTIIRSEEKIVINKEIPTKDFNQQEKQKETKNI